MRLSVSAAVLLAATLTACTSTPEEVGENSAPVVTRYSENYQEIYRRVSNSAKRCMASNMGGLGDASNEVDADLYPDLGYGEVHFSLINYGARSYAATAKIEKDGDGAKMTTKIGTMIAPEYQASKFDRWASGEKGCF